MVKNIVHMRKRGLGVRLAPVALAVAFWPASGVAQEDSPLKIGVINIDAIASRSPAGQQLREETLAFQQEVAAELQIRQEAAREIERRVAEASDTISVEVRRALEREYQDALTAFQRFRQDKQEEAAALDAEGRARIQEELGPVIEAVQAELGYDLVLDARSAIVVIYSERRDITQLVLDRLETIGPANP